MKPLIWAVLGSFVISGCVMPRDLNKEEVVRELKTTGSLDGRRSQKEAAALVNQTNGIPERKMGMRLNIIEWQTSKLPPLPPGQSLRDLGSTLEKRADFDIGILLTIPFR